MIALNRKVVVALLWAVLATALWGSTFIGPVAVEPIGPIYLVFGRYFVFGMLSLCVLAFSAVELAVLGRTNILAALHLGIFGYVGFYLFFALSATIGGGALASIVTGAMPAFVTITSNLISREVRWRVLIVPISITSGGVMLVNLHEGAILDGRSSDDLLLATCLSLAACAMWAYFVVVNGLILKRQNGPAINNMTWTALIGVGAFLASFLLLPFAGDNDGINLQSGKDIWLRYGVVIVLLATLGSWCASWSWNLASKSLSTVVMGQIIALETVFGLAFNLMWEGRWPSGTEFAGAALVFLGVVLCVRTFEKARSAQIRS